MRFLVLTTILWAFSFSLIGVYLSGQVDAWFCVVMRVGLALLVFLPFWRIRSAPAGVILPLMAIGGCQLGVMYLFYYQSFLYLTVPEVLLFTVLTPLYVTLIYDMLRLRFRAGFLFSAALAVLGAVVVRYDGLTSDFWFGFFVVQGANISFAVGQVAYKYLLERHPVDDQKTVFAWFYLGAVTVTVPAWLLFGDMGGLPATGVQWGVLLWLGLAASGVGYFAWNRGACQVDSGTLAIMNNVLIPAGLVVNLLIWGQSTNWLTLSLGGAIIAVSLWVHKRLVIPASAAV